jgi:hypothetical protein
LVATVFAFFVFMKNESSDFLPSIPSPEDLASAVMEHNPVSLLFNPPGMGNEWGQAQATRSISGVTSITFPPLLACGQPQDLNAKDYFSTADLMLDGTLVNAMLRPEDTVKFQWFPHMVRRSVAVRGMEITTECFMPYGEQALLQRIVLTNKSEAARDGTLDVVCRGGVAAPGREEVHNLWHWRPPSEDDNAVELHDGMLLFLSRHTKAVSAQGVIPLPEEVRDRCQSMHRYQLGPGEALELHYVLTLTAEKERAVADYRRLHGEFDAVFDEHYVEVARRIREAFTPGNTTYTGHLPQLYTINPDLWRLYYTSFATLFVTRANPPNSLLGPTVYRSIGCRILLTRTYFWDVWPFEIAMSLIDPGVMRKLIEAMLKGNVRSAAMCYFTGAGGDSYYPANHHALVRCAITYLRMTGDRSWLESSLGDTQIIDLLIEQATCWKSRDRHGLGLADYSDSPLLEVVPSYRGTVAGINIGNCQAMLDAAELAESCDRPHQASELRVQARTLADRIMDELFVPGGWFRCIDAEGNRTEVRHVYDILMALEYLDPFLKPEQRGAMLDFFWRELATPTWLHALSPQDPASTANVRADHQWCGSFPAWPAFMAKALLRHQPDKRTLEWLHGVAKTAKQGVWGQAHMVDTAFPTSVGGARKCPPENPYCNEWYEIAGVAFIDMILETVFGISPRLGSLEIVGSRLSLFDPNARLTGLQHQGRLYSVDANGISAS